VDSQCTVPAPGEIVLSGVGDCLSLGIAANICGCEPVPYAVRSDVVRVKTTSLPLKVH
jgi:hypothetical protein